MDRMIADAVSQLKTSINSVRTVQRRLYATNQLVVVRSTKTSRGRQLTTWSHATIVAAAVVGGRYVYRIRQTDGRGRHTYGIVSQSALAAV